jgi:hypothetical protein
MFGKAFSNVHLETQTSKQRDDFYKLQMPALSKVDVSRRLPYLFDYKLDNDHLIVS